VGFRFNNFLINGVPQRSLSGGQPREFAGGKSVPFDAVSEVQILLAPYDVRYSDFAGALVNAVTSLGTNWFQGSVFAYARNDALARHAVAAPYERVQYGFSVGGPILPDRLPWAGGAHNELLVSHRSEEADVTADEPPAFRRLTA